MSIGKIGGGGIGISSSVNEIEIITSIEKDNNFNQLTSVEKHITLLFLNLINYHNKDINISIKRNKKSLHNGYGSTVSLSTGLFYSLNILFGKPFSNQEIFEILINNYVESSNDKIHFGYETGVGEACILYGGLNMINKIGTYKGSIKTDSLYVLIAEGNKIKLSKDKNDAYTLIGATTLNESESIEKYGLKHQQKYGNQIETLIKKLEKAFVYDNISIFNKYIWELNKFGSFKRKLITLNEKVMINFVNIAKNKGAIYSGISSSGSSMFVLCTNETQLNSIKNDIMIQLNFYFDNYRIGSAGDSIKVVKIIKFK